MAMLGGFSSTQDKKNISDTNSDVSEFLCPVCLEIFDSPVTTQCGHTFCQNCLQECLRPQKPVCAVCRASLGHCTKAVELEALIQSSVAACKGCGTQVGLSQMRGHTAACLKYQEYIEEGVRTTAQSQPAIIRCLCLAVQCQTATRLPALTATARTLIKMAWLNTALLSMLAMHAKWFAPSVPLCRGGTRTIGVLTFSST
uniref:E3 ubiquitin-protein ligase RNF114 isoform X2 n=1 Tax=Doryrhamphus excisus TaxID=161450 RepID=UPI0025ADFDB2|nr:E3 ubiquitin-protein ligase RNF114 isoform X2 [Doryrhamphus excisus]